MTDHGQPTFSTSAHLPHSTNTAQANALSASSSSSSTASGLFSRRPSFFSKAASKSRVPPTPSAHTGVPPTTPETPPRRRHQARNSFSSSVADIGTTLRRSRSASLRTNDSSGTQSSHKRAPSATLALSLSPEKAQVPYVPPTSTTNTTAPASATPAPRPTLSISTFTRSKHKGTENAKPLNLSDASTTKAQYDKSPLSALPQDSNTSNSKAPFAMAVPVPLRYPPSQKEIQQAQRQQNSYANTSYPAGLAPAAPIAVPTGPNPNAVFQHIHELASKRISTLDYLRKAHEGRIYWFNTLLFAKTDLTRLPSFTPRNLSRRATNYLLLGFSLPTVLDLNSNSPQDYLKTLNALLLEFETYQSIHPPDGTTASSISRVPRIPQMFKNRNIMGKTGRRSSSAANDFPTLTPQNSFGNEHSSSVDSPPTDDLLLPNESYIYLQTPSLPFDPDFFSTFATLCDVLIDCYTKILSMLSTPESVTVAGNGQPSVVGDLFSKADAKIRKIILSGVVTEFEQSCRQGVKAEIGGVGKVVLGGLM